MSALAGLGLLMLITQVEIAGHSRVLVLDDCPAGLDGFYAPARNRIGLCRNNHSNDADHSVNELEEEAAEMQAGGSKI